jgi:hypothetical protein
MKATQLLHNLGQSIWLDNITRDLLNSGTRTFLDQTKGPNLRQFKKLAEDWKYDAVSIGYRSPMIAQPIT